MATALLEKPTVQPEPATPAPHIFGPAVSPGGNEYVWHLGVSHAGARYTVRVAYDPRPGADPGTTDVCISPSAPLDVGTAVLEGAYVAAVDAEIESRRRWKRLYGGLADALERYMDVRNAGIREWG